MTLTDHLECLVQRYPLIADHGPVGDLQTAAVISSEGVVDWYAAPRFDSPGIFSALLDHDVGGHFSLGPDAPDGTSKQLYYPGTAVLVTRFMSPDGVGELMDWSPPLLSPTPSDRHTLIRVLRCMRGTIRFRLECAPRFDFGRDRHMLFAFDRGLRLADRLSWPADVARWRTARDTVFAQVMEKGWCDSRRAFVQHYGDDVLDSSLLLVPRVGFASPTDPDWLSTLDAVERSLVSDSLVYRYDPHASPDGLRGNEGTFSLCSFLWVDAVARAGRLEQARFAFEKMLTYANHVGLFAEEIGPSGEQLGNFPQAFTHLALIMAATTLDDAIDRLVLGQAPKRRRSMPPHLL